MLGKCSPAVGLFGWLLGKCSPAVPVVPLACASREHQTFVKASADPGVPLSGIAHCVTFNAIPIPIACGVVL